MRSRSLGAVAILFLLILGLTSCSRSSPPIVQVTVAPEDVYRALVIAILSGEESAIRPLIVEHPDAALLWQGAYPPEVVALLTRQYQSMDISRIGIEETNCVLLESPACPIALPVVKIKDEWRVDASAIIESRKRGQANKNK